jgi:hypothetical protein
MALFINTVEKERDTFGSGEDASRSTWLTDKKAFYYSTGFDQSIGKTHCVVTC